MPFDYNYFLILVMPKGTNGFGGFRVGIEGVNTQSSPPTSLGDADGEQKSVIAKQRGLTDLGASEWV